MHFRGEEGPAGAPRGTCADEEEVRRVGLLREVEDFAEEGVLVAAALGADLRRLLQRNLPLVRRAGSQLYRSQILQENMRWKALAEIYTMHSFSAFWNPQSKTGERRTWPKQLRKGENERPLSSTVL